MAQFCFIGGFSFVQQAEDTEALTEFQFRSQFTDGFLSADDFFLSLEMFPQPVGEAVFPGLCAGTVDVLEKGMRTENIQIIGVEMGGVDVCFAVIERRRIVIQSGEFLLVDFHLLFQIVLAMEQPVVVFH